MLTEKEENLLSNKDAKFTRTFASLKPDISLDEMQNSGSLSKFSLSYCHSESLTLTNVAYYQKLKTTPTTLWARIRAFITASFVSYETAASEEDSTILLIISGLLIISERYYRRLAGYADYDYSDLGPPLFHLGLILFHEFLDYFLYLINL